MAIRRAIVMMVLTCALAFTAVGEAAGQGAPTFRGSQVTQAQQLGKQVSGWLSAADWFGPLAPIALSPFFGLACLSGAACYGPDWLQARSSLLSESGPFANPTLFWTMAMLTVATSLPRLTKISKPLAMASEKLEAYSAVIILVVMRLAASGGSLEPSSGTVAVAGITPWLAISTTQLPIDVLMGLAAVLNVLVINAVKLFFELLIWLTPIPLIDALFEIANKSICGTLLAVYSYSPALATFINLALLAACFVVFKWVHKRTKFYRAVTAGPILAWLLPQWFAIRANRLEVFAVGSGRAGDLRRFELIRSADGEGRWSLRTKSWLQEGRDLSLQSSPLAIRPCGLWFELDWVGHDGSPFTLRFRRLTKAEFRALGDAVRVLDDASAVHDRPNVAPPFLPA